MSKDTKFFVRPKVRFRQTDASEPRTVELKRSTDQKNADHSNKPKIRSIVTLDKPIVLLKPNKASRDQENINLKPTDNAQKIESLIVCNNTYCPCTDQIASPSIVNSDKIGNQKPFNDANNIHHSTVNFVEIDAPKVSNKSSSSAVMPSMSPLVQDKSLKKVLKSQNCLETSVSKTDYMKGKRGKENDALVAKKGIANTTKKASNLKLSHCKTKSYPIISTSTRKPNVTSKSSTTSIVSKKEDKKCIAIDVMPCHKYSKGALKNKTSPIKKSVIRDIIGPKIKPYIGPGVPRKKQTGFKVPETNGNAHVRPCTSGEKLARPEYNSIMCTINKLNEMKKQKVATDIERLPATYKNLINGKISSALDFPLDEVVYKNLVDLSIDEKQLPSRLTRSKDPEPRQKDILPLLSDFFTPVSTEEYCTPVSTKPRTPEAIDGWSAFRISDKIFEWKDILDHV